VDYFTITLTALAFRNPHGMSFAHAACDLLLLGCRAFGNYFTKTFFNAKEGTADAIPSFVMFTVGSPFFQRPTRDELHPSFA